MHNSKIMWAKKVLVGFTSKKEPILRSEVAYSSRCKYIAFIGKGEKWTMTRGQVINNNNNNNNSSSNDRH